MAEKSMLEMVHERINNELDTNTRTDTIFVLTAIVLNLLTLGINSAVAQASRHGGGDFTSTIVMFTLIALLIVINLVAELGLIRGREMRRKLMSGLLKMYKDQGVEGYYEASLIGDYKTRYNLFMLVVIFTGLVAIIIPLTVR